VITAEQNLLSRSNVCCEILYCLSMICN